MSRFNHFDTVRQRSYVVVSSPGTFATGRECYRAVTESESSCYTFTDPKVENITNTILN